jgi:hypothetical protein
MNTASVKPSSPLAVASVEGSDSNGPYLNIFLYYMDGNLYLNRIAGRASGTAIRWYQSSVVTGAANMKATTLMAATTDGTKIYIYYIKDGTAVYAPYSETIQSSWFTDKVKEHVPKHEKPEHEPHKPEHEKHKGSH